MCFLNIRCSYLKSVDDGSGSILVAAIGAFDT